MSQHLSTDRIAAWIAGDRTSEEMRHVQECAECTAELAQFEITLLDFRAGMRDWAGTQTPVAPAFTRKRVMFHPLRWGLAAAGLLVIASVPVWRHAEQKQALARIEAADVQLLEQVDAEVSRSVPRTMEPLMNLMSWSGAPGDDTTEKVSDETTQHN